MPHENSESSPLLRQASIDSTYSASSSSSSSKSSWDFSSRATTLAVFLHNHVIAILYLYLLVLEAGNYLQAAPRAAIYENIICHRHYAEKAVSSFDGLVAQAEASEQLLDHCKIPQIQDELAFVRGLQEMFDCLPGLFFAIPYGHLANKYGRKLILIASLLGMCLQYTWVYIVARYSMTFPLRLVWLSSLFLVIGGGQAVSRSLLFVIVSDVTPEKRRATLFFRVECVALVARAVASSLSSFMMTRDLWLPMIVGLALIYVGACVALLLPSTQPTDATPSDEAVRFTDPPPPDENSSLLGTNRGKQSEPMWRAIWKAISRDKRVVVILVLAIITQVSSRTTGLLLQYVSKRFDWTFARANMILVLRMVVTVIALLVLVPILTPWLPRLPSKMRPASKDLFLARLSTLLLAIGLVLMALASGPGLMIAGVTIFSSGFGAFSALRSVMTSVVLHDKVTDREGEAVPEQGMRKDDVSILYAAMSLGMTVAKSAAGPIYASLFHVGQKLGGLKQGVPFSVAAVLAFAVHGVLWLPQIGFPQSN